MVDRQELARNKMRGRIVTTRYNVMTSALLALHDANAPAAVLVWARVDPTILSYPPLQPVIPLLQTVLPTSVPVLLDLEGVYWHPLSASFDVGCHLFPFNPPPLLPPLLPTVRARVITSHNGTE